MTTAVTVTDRSALASALPDLKLSGMLATLDARLAQARAGELGHLDFLQVLCQDEISRRQSMSLARRIRRARSGTETTLEGSGFTASPKLPAAQIRDLAALRWLQAGESVILYGPVGAGKSQIAQALAHLAIHAGAEARFTEIPGARCPSTASGSCRDVDRGRAYGDHLDRQPGLERLAEAGHSADPAGPATTVRR